jgi:cation diffusion facilitator family transporter
MMSQTSGPKEHSHVFLGSGHERNERRTWAVIVLCGLMMIVEIVGGVTYGSLALVADGLHMSTHAGAMLIAALAYTYARRHATDDRFVFGTGKLGDLAGFTSAVVLAMIALLIGYEAVSRLMAPVPIRFAEAIPIACLGLLVNIVSAWLLGAGDYHHDHSHSHHKHSHDDDACILSTARGVVELSIHEQDVPPRFRLAFRDSVGLALSAPPSLETIRSDGARQVFGLVDRGRYWESFEEVPEPHEFSVAVSLDNMVYEVRFDEDVRERASGTAQHSAATHRDHNIRSAYIHVLADAVVSILAIFGLLLARRFGWLWMDPLAGMVGASVIANWSVGLVRDTGSILLDMNPDRRMADMLRDEIQSGGDKVLDLHLWRLGPGHLGALISVASSVERNSAYYHSRLERFRSLSHLTVEVSRRSD